MTRESPDPDRDTASPPRGVALTTNEPRARGLFDEIRRQTCVLAEVDFDDLDPLTKYTAAALSFRPSRAQWWDNYQMHPLIQRRRRRNLQRNLAPYSTALDALIMWGSWFHPNPNRSTPSPPFVNYIDQSMALEPALGEPPASPRGRRQGHALQAQTYADSAAIMCWSEWARDQTRLAHKHVPEAKLHVVGWGPCSIDLSAEEIPWSAREPLVLHVSSSFHRKGVDFLVTAAQRVKEHFPAARFVVIGDDVHNLPIQDGSHVEFLGRLTDPVQLASYFRRASVFFLPHRFDRSPHVLAEAMSAGIPLVVSEQGGPVEVTKGKGTGFCVPIGDIEGYADAIVKLLTQPALASDMGSRGKQLMIGYYNWPAVATKVLGIVDDVVRAKRTRI